MSCSLVSPLPSPPVAVFTREDNTSMASFLLTICELLEPLGDLDGSKGCRPDHIPSGLELLSSYPCGSAVQVGQCIVVLWLLSGLSETELHCP